MDITWQDWINSIYPIAASNNCILSSLKNKYPFPDHWIKKLVEWTIILVEFCLPVSATLKPVLWNVRSFLAIQWFQKDLQKQLCLPDHRGKKRGITHSRPHLMIDGYFHCSFFLVIDQVLLIRRLPNERPLSLRQTALLLFIRHGQFFVNSNARFFKGWTA